MCSSNSDVALAFKSSIFNSCSLLASCLSLLPAAPSLVSGAYEFDLAAFRLLLRSFLPTIGITASAALFAIFLASFSVFLVSFLASFLARSALAFSRSS